MFAAIYLGIAPPSLLDIATGLFQHVGRVKPAFEMPAAELAFLVLFVASSLSRFFDFDFVVRELRSSRCARGYGCCQKVHPSSSG